MKIVTFQIAKTLILRIKDTHTRKHTLLLCISIMTVYFTEQQTN